MIFANLVGLHLQSTMFSATLVGFHWPPMSSSITNRGGSSLTAYVQFNQEPRQIFIDRLCPVQLRTTISATWWVFIDRLCPVQSRTTISATLVGLHVQPMSSSIKNNDIRNLGGSSLTACVKFSEEPRSPQPWWIFIDRLCQVQSRTTISATLVGLRWSPMFSSIKNHDLRNLGGSSLTAFVQFNQEPRS